MACGTLERWKKRRTFSLRLPLFRNVLFCLGSRLYYPADILEQTPASWFIIAQSVSIISYRFILILLPNKKYTKVKKTPIPCQLAFEKKTILRGTMFSELLINLGKIL